MQTKRLIIRPVKMSGLDQMYAYTSDEENMKYERDVFTLTFQNAPTSNLD